MKLIVFLGTRPEIIKLVPVIDVARARGHEVDVVFSGQHSTLAEPLFEFFDLQPEVSLQVMTPGQSLLELSRRLLESFHRHLDSRDADFAVVQGDTTTAFLGGYWAFLRGIPTAHVEAGLRTYDLSQPFPEEANRQLLGRLATLHFAPTEKARFALLNEAIPGNRIFRVGNTGIDALHLAMNRLQQRRKFFSSSTPSPLDSWLTDDELILVTTHRRENFGEPLQGIAKGVLQLLDARPKARALVPVHPNPQVAPVLQRHFAGHPRIRLVAPLDYVRFLEAMQAAALILTDSGGVQEEAPTLGKRILVLREKTERTEGVDAGFARLVGTNPEKIVSEGLRALEAGPLLKPNPFGDGNAAARILEVMEARVQKLFRKSA